MGAGKLAHQEFPRVAWNMTAQIWLQPDQVKLFPGSNCRRMVEQVAHWNASLAVGQHRWIANMRVTIESAKSKPLPGIKKFTPEFRDIQLTFNVFSGESCSACCM